MSATTNVKLNEDGDPIFRLCEVNLPKTYPRHVTGNLRAKYNYLFTQYWQLRELWDVQLKNHRDHWNIQAAYDFWCENGTKTIHGRQFGWSEDWLIEAMESVKAELIDLEDAGNRIKTIKAVNRLTIDRLALSRVTRTQDEDLKKIRSKDSSSTGTEPQSPTHKPRRRPSLHHDAEPKKTNHRYNTRLVGSSREDPIVIEQDSDDEGGPPHRGRQRRTRSPAKDPSQPRRPPIQPSANTRVRRQNHTPERSHAHAPQTPVKQRRGRGSMSSPSSPSKKRARSRDGKDPGRVRKSPKRKAGSNAGSTSSSSDSKSSPYSDSSGEGGCPLLEKGA
ncbi:hypothetical protein VTN96DRAFT_6235 [Rasamsonia emersonii]|uniref:Uncharacterized protein n=1 Tax=Rasamsonia emersonii (strain ATCC 16479 / CBS 393.64 / IMI 116815) TaxID=1408163 RepID=A0A0F4YKQ3_RASE3|nr:hypothetical protein T310_7597 [Rasamsonia emersonii CBS 393.64]KKA18456.1 hypothetical protein T310_7597 [Rasamsonia emersonii CBS 393.64]